MNDEQKSDANWEREVLRDLANATLKEQRTARRWGIFFKLLFAAYFFLTLMIWAALSGDNVKLSSEKHTAVVELNGVIQSDTPASADNIVAGLREAFKHKGTKGVVLRINSPGGSPVQARYIHDEILRLRKKYPKIPMYAVVSDMCASGGYYVAVAADKIYADKGSLIGSIGVLMNGFGFVGAMEKLGVERRLLTAGKNKGILDPFSPLKEGQKVHVQNTLNKLHQQFIDVVKEGRGKRLKDNDQIFSGLFWSGEEAKELGLVDEFGSTGYVAREVIKVEETVNFTRKEDLLERLAERVGVGAVKSFAHMMGISKGITM